MMCCVWKIGSRKVEFRKVGAKSRGICVLGMPTSKVDMTPKAGEVRGACRATWHVG